MPMDEEKKIWLEEAWEGWIRPLTIIACIGLLALAYVRDWIPQPWMGTVIATLFLGITFGLVLGVVGVALVSLDMNFAG